MKKMRALFLLIGIIGTFMLVNITEAAIVFPAGETGSLSFGGYLENFSGLRMVGKEGKGKVDAFRNTFLPEFLFTFGQEAKLFASGRFVRETSYNLEDSTREKAGLAPLPDDYYDQTDFEAWELYLDTRLRSDVRLRTGKQFIIWGETDVFRLLDVINPQDSSWIGPAVLDLEETRVPIYAARLIWEASPSTNLEFVFVPMIDDQENRVDIGAPTGGRWKAAAEDGLGGPNATAYKKKVYPQMFTDLAALGYAGPATGKVAADVQTVYPERDLNQSRVGVRLSTKIGRLDLALMDYYGHNMAPAIFYEGTHKESRVETVQVAGVPTLKNVDYYIPKIRLRYKRQNIIGASFNYFDSALTRGVFKGEVAYYYKKPFNTFDPKLEVEKDVISYSLGWEKDCFMPWIHPDDPDVTVFTSLQIFQNIILGSDNNLHVGPYLYQQDKVTTTLTLKMFTGYVNDIYHPEIVAAYDVEGRNGLVRGTMTYNPPWSSKYKIDLIYVNYWGRFENMGLFREKDSAFLKLRYMW